MKTSIHLYCSWHRNRNFKKHFVYLNKPNFDKSLYNQIINLPYIESIWTFEESFKSILKNKILSKDSINYLKANYDLRRKWAKCYQMQFFTCGIFTTQRIESFHAQACQKLNLTSSLQEVLKFFIEYEVGANNSLEEEKETILPKSISKVYEKNRLLEKMGEIVHPYILEKIKKQYHDGLNYEVKDFLQGKKW